jgi:hypothetical protein
LVWIQVSPEFRSYLLIYFASVKRGCPSTGYVEGTNGVKHQSPHNTWGGKSLPHPPKGTGRAYKGVNINSLIKKTISFFIIRGGVPLHEK